MLVHLRVPAELTRLDSALASGADALWIEGHADAAAEFLRVARQRARGPTLFAFLGGLANAIDADLDAMMPAAPDGIILPGARNGADVQHLGAKLAVREAELDLADGATRIIARIAAPGTIFQLASFSGASPRLAALAFDARDLAAAIGVSDVASAPVALASSLTVLAAKSAGVAALAIAEADFTDRRQKAERDGFDGLVIARPDAIAALKAR